MTDSWRVVHGEGDGLSGLVIDKYNDLLVVQPYSHAFYRRREELAAILEEMFPGHRQVLKPASVAARREGIPEYAPPPAGEELEAEIVEGKMRLFVSPAGHKTVFFLDQRENRARHGHHGAGEEGARWVLLYRGHVHRRSDARQGCAGGGGGSR